MNAFSLGNLRVDGQIRRISLIKLKGQNVFVVVRNNDTALLIKPVQQ
jgi:hypothetical protein